MANRRVLVVDDDSIVRVVLSTMLVKWGYDVLTAENGLDGLEHFLAVAPHVVIVDWDMPGMNGGELAREIKVRSGQVPIVLLTSTPEAVDDVRYFDLVLVKPATMRTLRDALDRLGV